MTQMVNCDPGEMKRAGKNMTCWHCYIIWSILLLQAADQCPINYELTEPEYGVCPSLVISTFCEFQKLYGCRVIEGYLDIRNLRKNEEYKGPLEFPLLREISEFLLIYNLQSIISLETMFPNLAIIRGEALIQNYAIVIKTEPVTINNPRLPSLGLITRGLAFGSVTDGPCQEPIFKRWTEVPNNGGTSYSPKNELNEVLQTPQNDEASKDCSIDDLKCRNGKKCTSACIGQNCPLLDDDCCHPLCLGGCTKPNDPKECFACKSLTDRAEGGACIEECPASSFKFGHSCVLDIFCDVNNGFAFKNDTRECVSFSQKSSSQFELLPIRNCPLMYKYDVRTTSCIPCEQGDILCKDPCHHPLITTVDESLKLKDCINITGSLIIQDLVGAFVSKELVKNLGNIEQVEGKVEITNLSLRSVNFLKNLKVIHGRNQAVALIIENNEYLEDLDVWMLSKLRIKEGSVRISQNNAFCMNNIQKFLSSCCNLTNDGNKWISSHTNGLDLSCLGEDKQVRITSSAKVGTLSVTIPASQNNSLEDDSSSYVLIYKRQDDDQITTDHISDSCESEWKVIDLPSSSGRENLTYEIAQLLPDTSYAVTVHKFNMSKIRSYSKPLHVRTNPYNPSSVRNVRASTKNGSNVNVQWTPPLYPNGEKVFYRVSVEFVDIEFDARNVDICQKKGREMLKDMQYKIQRRQDRLNGIQNMSSEDILTEDLMMLPGLKSKLRKKANKLSCSREPIYEADDEEQAWLDDGTSEIAELYSPKFSPDLKNAHPKLTHCITGNRTRTCTDEARRSATTDSTSYTFKNLRRGGFYKASVVACHRPKTCPKEFSVSKRSSCLLCSQPNSLIGEVLLNEIADQVDERTINVSVIDFPKMKGISLDFKNPQKMKAAQILGFVVIFKSTEGYESPERCISMKNKSEKFISAFYDNLPWGNLSLSIHALTMTTSKASSPIYIYNPFRNKKVNWMMTGVVAVTFMTVLIVTTGVFLIKFWERRKFFRLSKDYRKSFGLNSRIQSFAALMYHEYDWRNETVIDKRGNFGIVTRVQNILDHKWYAVKSPKETTSHTDFIKEATLLRKVQECEHVIKFYGLVIENVSYVMELMENDNLLTFLQNAANKETCIAMRITWASNVSQGMAYLVKKNIIHRDLAARNILLDRTLVPKIADFGLAIEKIRGDTENHNAETHANQTAKELPICWMAPETLEDPYDLTVFSQYSDVWSFAVLLWEVITFGKIPFEGNTREDIIMHVLDSKDHLEIPTKTPEPFKHMMEMCFVYYPNTRPEFHCMADDLLKAPPVNYRSSADNLEVINYEESDSGISRFNVGTSSSSSSSSVMYNNREFTLDTNSLFDETTFISGNLKKWVDSERPASDYINSHEVSNSRNLKMATCSLRNKELILGRTSESDVEAGLLKLDGRYLRKPSNLSELSDPNAYKIKYNWQRKIKDHHTSHSGPLNLGVSDIKNYCQSLKRDQSRLAMNKCERTITSPTSQCNECEDDSGPLLSNSQSRELTFSSIMPIPPTPGKLGAKNQLNSVKNSRLRSNNSSPKTAYKFCGSLSRNKTRKYKDSPENCFLLSSPTSTT